MDSFLQPCKQRSYCNDLNCNFLFKHINRNFVFNRFNVRFGDKKAATYLHKILKKKIHASLCCTSSETDAKYWRRQTA